MATDAASAPAGEHFVQGIGPIQALSLVVGTMIGSGIFIVSADIGRLMGAWGPAGLMLVWVVTGVMTMAGALSYVELAAMMPKAGGQYVFLREGLNPLAGFLYGWTLFTVIQAGTIAAVAVAFAKFLAVLLPGVSDTVFLSLGSLRLPGAPSAITIGVSPQRLVAIASILVLTWINYRGVSLGARIQTTLTVAKVGALAALIVLGLTVYRQPEVVATNFGTFWGTAPWTLALVPLVGAAMVGSLFSSDAWNNVTFAAAEVRNPTRNLPLALAAGTALVTLCYLLANLAYFERAAPPRRPERRHDAGARHPVRLRGPSGDGGGRGDVRRRRRGGHGHRHHDLDPRLQRRADPGGAAGVLRDGARPALLRARRPPARQLPHPRLGALDPGALGFAALPERHLQPAAGLRHFRGAGVLLPHDGGALPAPSASSPTSRAR